MREPSYAAGFKADESLRFVHERVRKDTRGADSGWLPDNGDRYPEKANDAGLATNAADPRS